MQLPLWTPESDWRPPSMSSLPSWEGAKRVSVDTETRDEHLKELGIGTRRGAYIVGISFAIEDGPKHYLPYRHDGGDNLDAGAVVRYMQYQAKVFTGQLVGMNLSYDLDHLANDDIEFSNVDRFRDVQVADPLINELEQSYSLDNIAARHGIPGKDEELLRAAAAAYGVSPKDGMWRMPARFVGLYGEGDADRPLRIIRKQERRIDELDLWDIYDLECQVLPVLVKMRRRGVRIDQEQLRRVEEWSLTQEAEALAVIKRDTGYDIGLGNVWKAAALAPPLEAIGVRLKKTSTGAPSIDQELLGSVDHPVAKAIAWARKTNKLRTTFAASIRRYMTDGRIHCTFNQMAREDDKGDMKGARYGRLSAQDPNLQQQPSRDEFASMWRSIYVPDEGGLWACCDYSQQEPRWTTHFAAVMDLPGARAAARAYHEDPNLDNHQFMSDLTGLDRKFAKNIYLGLCYGKGGASMCDELGLPTRWALSTGRGSTWRMAHFATQQEALEAKREAGEGFVWRDAGEEGQAILDTFDQRAPFIKELAKEAKKVVERRGYIVTIGGRHLRFPQRADGSYDWVHKSLNRLIQGSSADQMKRALVELDRAGHYIQLQVHDEEDGTVPDVATAREKAQIMRECILAQVPFKVDVEVGENWGELKEAT